LIKYGDIFYVFLTETSVFDKRFLTSNFLSSSFKLFFFIKKNRQNLSFDCIDRNSDDRTKFDERVFLVLHAGPSAWNALPEDIRVPSDSVVFRRQLKTHYFNLAFNVS